MANHEKIPTTDTAQIERLIERLEQGKLEQGDAQLIGKLLSFLLSLITIVQSPKMTLRRFKKLIFDLRKRDSKQSQQSEKNERQSHTPDSEQTGGPGGAEEPASDSDCERQRSAEAAPKAKRVGHGRRPATDYPGAKLVRLNHPELVSGDRCPEAGCEGHLHQLREPKVTIYLTGQPVISATKYERPVLRCSDCFACYASDLPEEVKKDEQDGKPEKYDETADAAIALYKYGAGMPFYRQEKLQEACGVPIPASVQFERCEEVANACYPVYKHLVKLAANGKIHHIDDTRVRILSCYQEDKHRSEKERRGTHTTAIVVKNEEGHKIAIYSSGRNHAGENLDEVLEKRRPELPPPIKASDALAANGKLKAKTIEAYCLAHGHRKFRDLEEIFPAECQQVLRAIQAVFLNDERTRGLSDEERLEYHQTHSGPVMSALREWIERQFEERLVEPNNALSKSYRYLLNHFEKLTTFLRVPGAPIDNNEAERALKRFVLFRKNSLFYKTLHGAEIGGILMSLIESCRLNGGNPWEYLLLLMRNRKRLRNNPGVYLPWNYAWAGAAQELGWRAA
jgi:transposase